jgi:hypothetical protein
MDNAQATAVCDIGQSDPNTLAALVHDGAAFLWADLG